MASTVWNGSVDTDWNTAANWTPSGVPLASAHIQISTTNDCALDQSRSCASLTIDSGATLIGGGYKLTVTSEGDAASGTEGFAVNNDGIISGNLDLEINTTTATDIDLAGTSGNFQNLKLNDVSCDVTMKADCILDGTLIIAAGQLSTGTGGYGFSNLTVAGNCTVSAGATLEGNASSGATVRLYSLTVNGTYSATGGETIITGETGAGRAVDIVGTFTHNSGTLSIQSPMDTLLRWPSSSSAYHIKINDDDCIARPTGDNKPTIAGNLTITKGEFNTEEGGNDHALTVTGTITVNSTSNTAKLDINDSAVSCAKIAVETDDTIAASHSSNAMTVTGAGIGTGRSIDFTGVISGTLDIICTHPNTTEADLSASSGVVNHLTLNHASLVMKMNSAATLGNLTITAGEFTTVDAGGSSKALTVTGAVSVSGTLTCNASAISVFSLTVESSGTLNATSGTTNVTGGGSPTYIGFVIKNGATFNNLDGTVQMDNASESWINSNLDNFDIVFHHLIINGNIYINKCDIHCEGNLTINASKNLRPYNQHNNLTVDGNVIVNGTLGKDAWGLGEPTRAACSFGSLTINSGGTYIATQNTTTLTTAGASGTRSFYNNGGTFTHNNGTIKIDTSTNTNYDFDGDDLYNFTVECEDTNGALQCDGQASTPVTVLNNLDIVMGILRTNGNTFTVHGNVYVRATSKTNKNKFVGQQVTQNVYGLITVEDGAFYDLANQGSGSYGTLNAGGIRVL